MSAADSDSFALSLRVYYEDTDAAGVVYHGSYVKFFERARTEYLRRAGFNHVQIQKEWKVLFAVRHLSMEYLRPAFLDDVLEITARPTKRGRTWVLFSQTATRPADGETIASAEARIVCAAGSPLRAAAIPKPLADIIRVADSQ